MDGPCGWTIDRCGGCGTCWTGYSPETRERAALLASTFMWAATGRQFGLCEVTVLPCNPRPQLPLYETYPVAYAGGGRSYDVFSGPDGNPIIDRTGGCAGSCRCASACEVPLVPPVSSVVSVTVAGVTVDPGAYQVHDGWMLVRIDGLCWPTCQRYNTGTPNFAVTYLRGDPIPAAVQNASEALACEYAKACTGGACRLPERLASLSRQGIDITMAEVDKAGGRLRTDIKFIDDTIDTFNPAGRAERWQAPVSPDMPIPRTVTSSNAAIAPASVEGTSS